MAKELQKYGLQMPAFSKIGGILANEMPIDEAALHAAILAINDAIEKQSVNNTLNNLKLYDAHLINVIDDNAKYYLEVMYEAKFNKSTIAKNKATEIDYVPDVYDELLTQAEIQGFIYKVNSKL
jgi:Ras GTPase-activating-like protein IQGAP1